MRPGALPRPAAGPVPAAVPALAVSALAVSAFALTGCGGAAPAASTGAPETTATSTTEVAAARARLAARAAAAQDRRFAALYTLSVPGTADRTVVATVAADGSWRVDVPGGALGGTADVAVVQTEAGIFQCGLPSAERPVEATCVRVADPDGVIEAAYDPRVQRPFADWPDVLTDRRAPLAVSTTRPLPGVTGDCFAVDSTSASLTAPLDVGIYCYAEDGVLTGARLGFGTLTLLGEPGPPPASVTLPGPVVGGEPLGMAAPPPPPSPEPSDPPADGSDPSAPPG